MKLKDLSLGEKVAFTLEALGVIAGWVLFIASVVNQQEPLEDAAFLLWIAVSVSVAVRNLVARQRLWEQNEMLARVLLEFAGGSISATKPSRPLTWWRVPSSYEILGRPGNE